MTKRTAKTEVIYVIQSHTGYGWEDETAEAFRWEAVARRNEYRANSPLPCRMIERRVWKDTQEPYRGPRA
jgi:hypothetical protein